MQKSFLTQGRLRFESEFRASLSQQPCSSQAEGVGQNENRLLYMVVSHFSKCENEVTLRLSYFNSVTSVMLSLHWIMFSTQSVARATAEPECIGV